MLSTFSTSATTMPLTLHRRRQRQPVVLLCSPSVSRALYVVCVLLALSPPPDECGNVAPRRRPGASSGVASIVDRGHSEIVRQPPCPSESCRCRWTKQLANTTRAVVAQCRPSADRSTITEMFEVKTRSNPKPSSSPSVSPEKNVVFGELHIWLANLTKLPADSFQRAPTRLLDLTGNRFVEPDSISVTAFAGLESVLNILVLNDCGLTTVPTSSLSRLAALRVLRLEENSIVSLSAGVFSFGVALRELHVLRNSIEQIDPRAFHGLVLLEKLSLADNRITSLAPGTLSSLVKLASLDVSNNRMSALEPGWLNGLSALKWLEIHSNRIESIGVGTFRGATRLRSMRAENNALSSVEDGAFRPIGRLDYLSIDLSNVTTLTGRTLLGLGRLKTLNLGEQRRASLPDGFFAPLRQLNRLSLTDYEGMMPPDLAIREEAFGHGFRFRQLNVWLAPIRRCQCSVTWIRRLGALGAYVHGLCVNKKPLSCPAGGKSAATGSSGKNTGIASAGGGKHKGGRPTPKTV